MSQNTFSGLFSILMLCIGLSVGAALMHWTLDENCVCGESSGIEPREDEDR